MATKRRYWGVLPPLPAPALAGVAKQCEALGLEGVWAIQLWGPPFVTLGAAAMASSRLKLGSGVALAFTRSPLETAAAALDVDTISGGRMVLGLGPSVRWWNEQWFGVHYGKPIAHLLLQANATITICHSRTSDLARYTLEADVLVVAVGSAEVVTPDMVKQGSAVVDVGINRTEGGIVGDVAPDARDVAGFITPVPGGVGPMTIAMLLRNAVKAARYRRGLLAFPRT